MKQMSTLDEKIYQLQGKLNEFMDIQYIKRVEKNAVKKAIWLKDMMEAKDDEAKLIDRVVYYLDLSHAFKGVWHDNFKRQDNDKCLNYSFLNEHGQVEEFSMWFPQKDKFFTAEFTTPFYLIPEESMKDAKKEVIRLIDQYKKALDFWRECE